MKKYEKESLLKSFFFFFILLELFLIIIFYQNYKENISFLKKQIFNQMYNCSWTLKCEEFKYSFVKERNISFKLQKSKEYYAIFKIPNAKTYSLKISYPLSKFKKQERDIRDRVILRFVLYSLLLALIVFIISLFSLKPIKKALYINEEFIKDILHDLNTPLSSIVFNASMIKDDKYKKFTQRINRSIKTIISLQSNLKTFLKDIKQSQIELVAVEEIVKTSIQNISTIYIETNFKYIEKENFYAKIDKVLLLRVFDNLLSNSAKYNSKDNKWIKIVVDKPKVYIIDNGDGIKESGKIFNRFYKEHQRGIGIGLHIVKKICDELNIKIDIKSTLDKGTTVILDFRDVTDE